MEYCTSSQITIREGLDHAPALFFRRCHECALPKLYLPRFAGGAAEDGSSRRCIFRYMQKPTFDPGLTQQFTGVLQRSINKDGSFNVYRRGVSWRDLHPYLRLLNMSWTRFLGVVLAA